MRRRCVRGDRGLLLDLADARADAALWQHRATQQTTTLKSVASTLADIERNLLAAQATPELLHRARQMSREAAQRIRDLLTEPEPATTTGSVS
ncbi:hypothetical protein OG921_26310 [Aldersonia sp. NBC_00410]|uniref:hypothetical protein n=1 Tax=Aldersonia sp. NBC_00410 TaxID=2975954 RepID=UPI00224D3444|nr:hypothetical protein [Aldersonia sp. NBC_00410]MCX5046693.1 hypothetical protein [Aldersonia sp. NBC_00410]